MDGGITDRAQRALRVSEGVALGAIALLYLEHAARFRFLADDAFIAFRYARNWADGHGLRYNLGDHTPVEGYSDFGWVAICALVDRLGGDVPTWAIGLSTGAGLVLVLAVYAALRRTSVGAAVVGAMAMAASTPFAVWGTGGLETSLYALLVFVAFERLVLRPGAPDPIAAGAAGAGLALVRVEGIAWGLGIFALAALARPEGRRSLWRYLAIVGAVWGGWWLARYGYYGLSWPNTVYAKVSPGVSSLSVGLDYVATSCLTALTPMAIALTAPLALRAGWTRAGRAGAAAAAATLALAGSFYGYAIAVGGDWMPMGRFLIPALAPQALLLGWAADGLWRRADWRPVWRGAAIALGALYLAAGALQTWEIHPVPESARERFHFRHNHKAYMSEVAHWRWTREDAKRDARLAMDLRDIAQPGDSLVRGAIGVVGYYTDLFIYDRYGLVTREVVLADRRRERASPGHHTRAVERFFAPMEPTYMWVKRAHTRTPAATAKRLAGTWRKGRLARYYAPQLHMTGGEPGGERSLVVVYRRIEGQTQRAAWEAWEAQLAAARAEADAGRRRRR